MADWRVQTPTNMCIAAEIEKVRLMDWCGATSPHTREGREREGEVWTGRVQTPTTQEKSEKVRYDGLGWRPDPYHTREGRERR
jgi:hypothetical protein